MKNYFAVEYLSSKNTTAGTPNPRTGRMSKACNVEVFSSKTARDSWVSYGKITTDMQGNCRESITKKEAKELKSGWTISEFDEYCKAALDILVES